jgi:hypothetical protein
MEEKNNQKSRKRKEIKESMAHKEGEKQRNEETKKPQQRHQRKEG